MCLFGKHFEKRFDHGFPGRSSRTPFGIAALPGEIRTPYNDALFALLFYNAGATL